MAVTSKSRKAIDVSFDGEDIFDHIFSNISWQAPEISPMDFGAFID